jgi:adenylate cyclase
VERKLTAIRADVYVYSRLMGEDEEATLRTLSAYRKIIEKLIENHRGRFVNSAGDSVLAQFASVVEAVNCAVEIRDTLKVENQACHPSAGWNSASASIPATSWSKLTRFMATAST